MAAYNIAANLAYLARSRQCGWKQQLIDVGRTCLLFALLAYLMLVRPGISRRWVCSTNKPRISHVDLHIAHDVIFNPKLTVPTSVFHFFETAHLFLETSKQFHPNTI